MTIVHIIIAAWLGVMLSYILRRVIKLKNKRWAFYLTRCDMNKTIMIIAHHFKYTGDTFVFYDGWGNVLFHTSYGWTNVYRGREF